jgi:tetraacyldisaccharide-1-P 4'-kinase
MPLTIYLCEDKHSVTKFYRQVKDAPACVVCECGKEAKKTLSAPNSTSKITIDNGFQAKAVEVNPEIVSINKERSEKDYRQE